MEPAVKEDETTGYLKTVIDGHAVYLMPAIHNPTRENPDCYGCYFDKPEYEVAGKEGTLCSVLYDREGIARNKLCYDDRIYVHPRALRRYLKQYMIRKLEGNE